MTTRPTETQHLEQRITAALTTIREDHPLILPTEAKAAVLGHRGQTSLIKRADDDEHGDDIDVLTRRVDASHHVTIMVNGWARLVVEDKNITETLPDGFSVTSMCAFLERWAQWASWHTAAEDMASELEGLVTTIRQYVPARMEHEDYKPPIARWKVGSCPLETEQPDDEGDLKIKECGGAVYAYPDDDAMGDLEDPRDPWTECGKCGERAVASWWQGKMFPEVEEEMRGVDRPVTADEIVTLAKANYGKSMTRQAVWQWVNRGRLHPIDPNVKPHRFKLSDVIDTLTAQSA